MTYLQVESSLELPAAPTELEIIEVFLAFCKNLKVSDFFCVRPFLCDFLVFVGYGLWLWDFSGSDKTQEILIFTLKKI